MDGLTEGRIVHYVMPDGSHRAAIITKVWNDRGLVNLNVFADYTNDLPYTEEEKQKFTDNGINLEDVRHGHIWKTSISFLDDRNDPKINTWHWIEKA